MLRIKGYKGIYSFGTAKTGKRQAFDRLLKQFFPLSDKVNKANFTSNDAYSWTNNRGVLKCVKFIQL